MFAGTGRQCLELLIASSNHRAQVRERKPEQIQQTARAQRNSIATRLAACAGYDPVFCVASFTRYMPYCITILEITPAHGMSDAELEQVLPGYDAVVVRSANRVTRGMLVASPRVAVVGRAGSGVDNIDLDAAFELGVPVVNAPTGNAGSVAGQPLFAVLIFKSSP